MKIQKIPRAFFWRRIHSLAGLWLTIYLIFHLLTNSQAALFLGDDGRGFITSVNNIHEFPYLLVLEILILGIPIAIHTLWGIQYALQAKSNVWDVDNAKPSLPEYSRNWAYTFQRITSWILIVGLGGHIIHMRFYEYPEEAQIGSQRNYMVRVENDEGLQRLSERLGFEIFDKKNIENAIRSNIRDVSKHPTQKEEQNKLWLQALRKRPVDDKEVIVVANDFGTADLLMLRNAFKSPLMMVLYTIFVLSACFHGFNGLWTFLIKWGVTLSERSQMLSRRFSTILMVIVTFLGLAAIWGTYWNLSN